MTRFASWYLRKFPIVRGRGIINQLLGKFLEVEPLDGIRIRLINPLEYNQRVLLFGQGYEVELTQFLSMILQPGMVFIDVGANLGYYTLLAAKRVGSEGRVHAFEPAPVQFGHLCLNIRVNGVTNVALNNCAVAECSGEADLFLADGWNQGIHSFARTLGQQRHCRVQCTSLDEYVEREGITRVDLIKVDVEGAELSVFRGGNGTLASLSPPVLVFEASEKLAQSLGYSTRDVKQLLGANGYEVFRIEGMQEPVRADASVAEGYANLVAIHSSAGNWYYDALATALLECYKGRP